MTSLPQDVADTTESPSSLHSSSRLLELPAEIREHIYREIFSTANSRCPSQDPEEPDTYQYHLDVLHVNHQIYHEAKKIFQDNVFIKITTPWPEAIGHIRSEGKVPTVAIGDKAASFQDFHLWVFIDTPGTPYPRHHDSFSMLICLEDLEAFTRMWHFSNLNHYGLNQHLRLKLTVQDPHVPDRKIHKTLQRQLLLPFGRIKDLNTFSVHGPKVLQSVQDALNEERSIPDPSPEECLERGNALKEVGNNLVRAGAYHAALDKYVESFAAVHITVSGRSRIIHAEGFYIRELTTGPDKGMRGDFVRLVLRVALVANIILVYMNLEDWEEAYFWGKRSVVLFRQGVTGDDSDEIGTDDPSSWLSQTWAARFPARDAMGKIFYRTAIASRALGKASDTTTLIKAAALYLPNDAKIRNEMTSLSKVPAPAREPESSSGVAREVITASASSQESAPRPGLVREAETTVETEPTPAVAEALLAVRSVEPSQAAESSSEPTSASQGPG